MKVVVSGASRYIGSVLCDYLRWRGHKVQRCDLPDFEFLHLADRLVHLAGTSKAGVCDKPDFEIAVVRQACAAMDPAKVIYASSCAVYPNSNALQDETSRTAPSCAYGSVKLACEEIVIAAGGSSIRCGAVCGPSPSFRSDLAVNGMVLDAFDRGVIRVFGPDDWRPHAHILDVCAGYALAVESPSPVGIMNVVGWNSTILDIARSIIRVGPDATIRTEMCASSGRSYRVVGQKFRARFDQFSAISDVVSFVRSTRKRIQSCAA